MAKITDNFSIPKEEKTKDRTFCSVSWCNEKWVIDRMCRKHYNEKEEQKHQELKARRDHG